jgi:hypothetical protein
VDRLYDRAFLDRIEKSLADFRARRPAPR